MRVFAIRIGKYVEFRMANRSPRVKVSQLTRVVDTIRERLVITDDYPYYGYMKEPVKQKQVLKTVCPVGGRVLGVVTYAKYSRGTVRQTEAKLQRKAPKFGKQTVIEVSKAVATGILRGAR